VAKPFIGRVRELEELAGGLDDATSGRGSVFVVSGEPGIGKSRLVNELAGLAASRAFRVAWGRCWQGEGAPAYWPWMQVLEALGEELPAVAASVSDDSHARFALFREVLDLLGRACEARPCLVIFDDLHAADPSSLALLQLVVGALRDRRIVVVGTCRDRDTRLGREAASLLPGVLRDCTFVPMRRFSLPEVVAFAERMGLKASAAVVAEVQRVTEGNPLFVEQVLRVLGARGEASARAEPIPIPFTVREAIRARVAALTPEARDVVEVAAVLGQEVSIPLLATVAARPQAQVVSQIGAAVAAGVLVEHAPGRVAFSHILLRDELYAGIEAERRSSLHALAARATAPDHSLDAIAHHAIEAAAILGAEAAAEAALRAAERSVGLLAFEDAAALLDRALAALEPSLSPATVIELLLARGLALIRLGEVPRGKQACEAAAALARSLGAPRELARAALTYGVEHTPALVDRRLVGLLEESLAALPQEDKALRARALGRLAAALQPAPDPAVPMRMAREAIAQARPLDPATRRATFYAAASALADWGDPRERIALNREMAELAEGAGDKVQALRSHARLVFDFMEAGDVTSADHHLAVHESLAQEFREPRYRWHSPLMRAMRALFEGRYADFDRIQEQAEAAMQGSNDLAFQGAFFWQRCLRLLDEDRFDELLALEPRVRALLAPSPFAPTLICAQIGRLHARRGDRDRAASEVAALGDLHPPAAGPLLAALLAEPIAVGGSAAQRDEAYTVLFPFADRLVNLGFSGMAVEAPVARLLGLLASASGRSSDAVRHFDDAIARLERLGAPRWLARTRAERDTAARGGTVPAAAASSTPRFTLRLEGETFAVLYGERVFRVKDSRGLRLLSYLVEHPGQDHHVLALAGAHEGAGGDAGEVIDRKAAQHYKARIEDLREELSEAERFADAGRAERAREELEALEAELARGFGIGGRSRKAAADAERARVNVQRHLRKAIRKLGESAPALEKHLEWAVKTGTYCSYRSG
jgi:hypothetical protein